MNNRVNIIIPVYADWGTLRQCINALTKYYVNNQSVDVYFVNDGGQEADILEKKIQAKISRLSNFSYHRNEKNLGFVKNCNNAVFNVVSDKKADILLLNSDTIPTEGFVEEMSRILYSQKDIGLVNPRSNNATIWSVPMDSRYICKPKRSYKLWRNIKNSIPEKYTSPLSHGFCMLIRREVIDEIKFFDEIYGKGYGEENDFAMRAYHHGWLSASANYAFVFHHGSKSFGDEVRNEQGERNMKILLERYPDYLERVQEYVANVSEPFSIHSNTALLKATHLLAKSVEYGHYNGYKSMFKKGLDTLKTRLAKASILGDEPRIQVWTHQISYTGAPMVLADLLRKWRDSGMPDNVSFCVPQGAPIDSKLHAELHNDGFNFVGMNYISTRFNTGDIVILNSSAYPDWLLQRVLSSAKDNIVKHIFLYIHEDDDSMLGVLKQYSEDLRELINKNQLTVYAPSSNSIKNWQNFFQTKVNIHKMSGRISYNKDMFSVKKASDFEKIDFIIAGSSEPHKGQLGVLYALISFYNHYYQNDKRKYRDFSLTISGIKPDAGGYYVSFIENAAVELGKRVKLIYNPDLETMHGAMSRSNFTVTYSIKDSFSLVTVEGMAFGHPIIRSESSGRDEQLTGKNGWPTETTHWGGLVETLEEILNKDKTSGAKLAAMSRESVKIAKKNYSSEYRIISDVKEIFS